MNENWTFLGTTDGIQVEGSRISFGEGKVYVKPFETKDSGSREERPSGYVRDTQVGKPRFDLLLPLDIPYDAQMLTRLAQLLGRGAEKYSERNWERADDIQSLERFKASALRHLLQWFAGEVDEDHAAAVMYNVLAHESTKWKMENEFSTPGKMENLEDSDSGHRDITKPGAPLEPLGSGLNLADATDGELADDLLGWPLVPRNGHGVSPYGWCGECWGPGSACDA